MTTIERWDDQVLEGRKNGDASQDEEGVPRRVGVRKGVQDEELQSPDENQDEGPDEGQDEGHDEGQDEDESRNEKPRWELHSARPLDQLRRLLASVLSCEG